MRSYGRHSDLPNTHDMKAYRRAYMAKYRRSRAVAPMRTLRPRRPWVPKIPVYGCQCRRVECDECSPQVLDGMLARAGGYLQEPRSWAGCALGVAQ